MSILIRAVVVRATVLVAGLIWVGWGVGLKAATGEWARFAGAAEPFYEDWEEEVVFGVLDTAMDGTVLLLSLQEDPHPDRRSNGNIYVKRSEDGGATWSDHKLVGERYLIDWKALGIGPYDGSARGREKDHAYASLGTSVVDENTGEIMIFVTSLYPAPFMYKSQDHGKTWKREKVVMKPDSRGFLSVPNGACDPGITIRRGPHKGRLLVPSRVFKNYDRLHEDGGYTCAIWSDDHGKTWQNSEPFPLDGTGESGLVELLDGTIYLNSRTHIRPGNRWVAWSDDSGHTWRDLVQDDELFDGPPDVYGCKAGLLRLDRDDADVLLFSSPTPHVNGRRNIRVWVSFDGGKTWPHNRLIRRGPGNYTWMTEGRKGTPSEGFIYLLSGKDWMARFNMAWLLNEDQPDFILGKRSRYRFADPDLFRKADNAQSFRSADPRFKNSQVGYRLQSRDRGGDVMTHPMVLPSKTMKLNCDVSDGRLQVLVMDEGESKLRDSHWITGDYEADRSIPWQDGPLDKWVGKVVYLKFFLEGNAQIFDVSFEGVPAVEGVKAGLDPSDERFVLPPRHDYVVGQTPQFIKTAENALPFGVKEEQLKGVLGGYRLTDASKGGYVQSHKFSLAGKEMKISCDASEGSVRVVLLGADGKMIRRSLALKGGVKVREVVLWPDGFKLDPHVSEPVFVRFELEGGAKVYGLRFDRVFWE